VGFRAARTVWRTCRAGLRVTINAICAGLLAIVRSRPDLLLTTAHIGLKLRRPQLALDAVAGMSAIDVRKVPAPERIDEQMTKIASTLWIRGSRAEAQDVLRKAIALLPHAARSRAALILFLEEDLRAAGGHLSSEQWTELENLLEKSIVATPHVAEPRLALARCLRQKARHLDGRTATKLRLKVGDLLRATVAAQPSFAAPRLALADFLLENLRYVQAEAVAAAGLRCCPSCSELHLTLARIQFQRRRFDDAAKTIEGLLAVVPDNGWAWFEYGKILWSAFGPSDDAFERAGDLSGNDSVLLAAVAQQFMYDLDYVKAAKYYERLFNLESSMRDNFVIGRYYATCLKEITRTQEASNIIERALRNCRMAAKAATGEGLELIKREEALLLAEAGLLDESFTIMKSIEGITGSAPRYDRAEYLPRSPERLQRLAEIVASRDVFVLLQGPSFATFAARLREFAGFEFAVATLNSFPPIERELARIHRHAAILLFTQPGSVQSWYPELMEFLERPSPNLLIANRYAFSGLQEFGMAEEAFIARYDQRLLLVHSDGPPLPSRPLHFENGPTLSWLIPLLLFARPRRIFLFGADGGSNPSFSKRPYFYYDDYDAVEEHNNFQNRPSMVSFKRLPEKLHEYNRRQQINAINGDRVINFALRSLEAHFGIQVPPIFNVCPHSVHRVFPRIDIDDALAMLAHDRVGSTLESCPADEALSPAEDRARRSRCQLAARSRSVR
jgi:tetratricopeptide (TPR) repeat protein